MAIFTPIAQTALKPRFTIKCPESGKPRLIYAKKEKNSNGNKMSMKRIFDRFKYVCRIVFHDSRLDERKAIRLLWNRFIVDPNALHCIAFE